MGRVAAVKEKSSISNAPAVRILSDTREENARVSQQNEPEESDKARHEAHGCGST